MAESPKAVAWKFERLDAQNAIWADTCVSCLEDLIKKYGLPGKVAKWRRQLRSGALLLCLYLSGARALASSSRPIDTADEFLFFSRFEEICIFRLQHALDSVTIDTVANEPLCKLSGNRVT